MVLVLALGDLHILHRAPDLPAKFMSMLAPGKDPAYIVCTGNLCIKGQLGVDIFVTGHTHCHQFTAYKHQGGVLINPGSAAGALSSMTYAVNPSFVLMDMDGLHVVVYACELIAREVEVDKINFKKTTATTAH